MSDSITIARPYAKAIFEQAFADQRLPAWSDYLQRLSSIVSDSAAIHFITNPTSTRSQHADLLLSLMGKVSTADEGFLKNFISVLAQNKRLLVIPYIMTVFNQMREQSEKTLAVDVRTYSRLSEQQELALIQSLSQRFQRKVALNVLVDKELIGGAVINAGGLVIDGSVRYKLTKLLSDLAA